MTGRTLFWKNESSSKMSCLVEESVKDNVRRDRTRDFCVEGRDGFHGMKVALSLPVANIRPLNRGLHGGTRGGSIIEWWAGLRATYWID